MICQKCKKNIIRPLELYNGDWACPVCKNLISISSIVVVVTKENDEPTKLGELCYLRSLKTSKTEPAQYTKNINLAIEYCRTGARMGNPKALIRLGFLYEYGYISSDDLENFRIACEYYRLVWKSTPEVRDKLDDVDYNDGCRGLRNAAAKRYLELIKRRPEYLKHIGNVNYRDEREKIRSKGLTVPADEPAEFSMGDNIVTHVFNILQSLESNEGAPLFGLIKLEKGEFGLVRNAKETVGIEEVCKLTRYCKSKVIVLFDIYNSTFLTLKTESDINYVDGDQKYFLFFFNKKGKQIISNRKCDRIYAALAKSGGAGEFNGVRRLIEVMSSTNQRDFIFNVDDVLMYKSHGEPFGHATNDLINTVVNI